MIASRPDQVWALDFQFDATAEGRQLKHLRGVDEFTREALVMRVGRSCDADQVVTQLEQVVTHRGAPEFLRCDNGPEFIAAALADWCRFSGSGTVFIEPGSPWQNPHVESFNAKGARRAAERDRVLHAAGSAGAGRRFPDGLQLAPATFIAREPGSVGVR
ncbi:MAG: DDE-type integrase/transposase/recombinase [Actinomycetota bacterium]